MSSGPVARMGNAFTKEGLQAAATREKPVSILDLIKQAYGDSGKKLAVSRSELKSLAVSPDDADEEERVVRSLAAQDHLLAVPPRLLLLIAESDVPIALRRRLLHLLVLAIGSHPVFEDQSEQLLGADGETSLSARQVCDIANCVAPGRLGFTAGEFRQAARARLRSNAVTSFVLLRALQDNWSVDRYINEMVSGLWADAAPTHGSTRRMIAALGYSREPGTLGILCGHYVVRLNDAMRRIQDAAESAERESRRAHIAEGAARRTEELLAEESAMSGQLRRRIEELQAELNAERDRRVVVKSHLVDDYESLRTRVIRRLTGQVELLGDGLHALRHGSTAVAEEFLDRSLTALSAEIGRLKDSEGGGA